MGLARSASAGGDAERDGERTGIRAKRLMGRLLEIERVQHQLDDAARQVVDEAHPSGEMRDQVSSGVASTSALPRAAISNAPVSGAAPRAGTVSVARAAICA